MIRSFVRNNKAIETRAFWFLWCWVLPALILLVLVLKVETGLSKVDTWYWLKNTSHYGLVLCFLLLPVNLSIESLKWKYIIDKESSMSFGESMKIILVGKSLNMIGPVALGDSFSKYLGLERAAKRHIFAALSIDRVTQFIPSIFFGSFSFFFLLKSGFSFDASIIWVGMSLIIFGIAVVSFWVYLKKESFRKYTSLLLDLSFLSFSQVLLFSLGRYVVFFVQFYLILWALDCNLSKEVIVLGIAWIFFVKTILPSLSMLGDLVNRGVSATIFFSFFTPDVSQILVASFIVWLINIVMPAIAGLFFISDLKKSF